MATVKTLTGKLPGRKFYTGRQLSLCQQKILFERVKATAINLETQRRQLQTFCPGCLSRGFFLSAGQPTLPTTWSRCSTSGVFNNQPPSWLFVSNAVSGLYGAHVNLQLGLATRLSGEKRTRLQDNLRARNSDIDLDSLVQDFNKLVEIRKDIDEFDEKKKALYQQRSEMNEANMESVEKEIAKMKEQSLSLQPYREEVWKMEEKVMFTALKLPNDLHSSTPVNESPVTLKEKNGVREPQSVNHVKAGEKYDLIKFSNVGPKAYYLKGELAMAEWAISDLACDYMQRKGYRLITSPEFVRSPIVEGCGRDIFDTDEVLTMQHTAKGILEPMNHLAGISPMTFAAYVAKLCISDKLLPYKFFSCGKAYQKNTLPGLFGALQSTQVGLFSCVPRSDVDAQFDESAEIIWKLLESLGFSLRLISVPAPELRREEKRRLELQVYAPSLDRFIAIGHVSDLGDFVSRRLMTCHKRDISNVDPAPLLHMVSGTVVNITSLLAVWMEHTDLEQMTLGLGQ